MACFKISRSFFRLIKNNYPNLLNYSSCTNFKGDGVKVVLLNSYNSVGITAAYLLRKTTLFSEICLQDLSHAHTLAGVAADLNNINSPGKVTYKFGPLSLDDALTDANIVVILEKEFVPQKVVRDEESDDDNEEHCNKLKEDKAECKTAVQLQNEKLDLVFQRNAKLCATVAESYAKICPSALLAVITQPINSTIPLICKVARHINYGINVNKIFGFMNSDVTTANLMWVKKTNMKVDSVNVPIIGGSSMDTIIPLFSQIKVPNTVEKPPNEESIKRLTEEVRKLNDLCMLEQKNPISSASIIANFITSLATTLHGKEAKECVYMASDLIPGVKYLAGTVILGPGGAEKMAPVPKQVSKYEKILLESVAYYLNTDIKRGENYALKYLKTMCKP